MYVFVCMFVRLCVCVCVFVGVVIIPVFAFMRSQNYIVAETAFQMIGNFCVKIFCAPLHVCVSLTLFMQGEGTVRAICWTMSACLHFPSTQNLASAFINDAFVPGPTLMKSRPNA